MASKKGYDNRNADDVVGYRVAEQVVIDNVVAVNQPVAHADELWPGDSLVFVLGGWRNAIGRLADDFDQPSERQLHHSIALQIVSGLRCPCGVHFAEPPVLLVTSAKFDPQGLHFNRIALADTLTRVSPRVNKKSNARRHQAGHEEE